MFDISADPTQPWTRTQITTGIQSRKGSFVAPQAAPGIFGVGDIDGDADKDILLSGDGDPHVYWLQQHAPAARATAMGLAFVASNS